MTGTTSARHYRKGFYGYGLILGGLLILLQVTTGSAWSAKAPHHHPGRLTQLKQAKSDLQRNRPDSATMTISRQRKERFHSSRTSSHAGLPLIDAVKATLSKQPSIRIQRETTLISKGAVQNQAGQFDTNLAISVSQQHQEDPFDEADQLTYDGETSSRTDQTTYSIKLKKLLRNGISIEPSIQNTRIDTSPPPFAPEADSSVDFRITVPLLQGLGVAATGAQELAAKNEYRVSLLTFRHTVSRAVANTVLAYWNYVAAKEKLNELIAAEARARSDVKDIKLLIAANQRPAGDLEQALANLAQKTSTRITAEQSLMEAQQKLALAIGLPYRSFQGMPLPNQSFPKFPYQRANRVLTSLKALTTASLIYRSDYQASVKSQRSDKILLKEAKNAMEPKLDLGFNVGYSGLKESNDLNILYNSFYNHVPGASVGLSLTYSFPLRNDAAKGVYAQRRATLTRAKLQTEDLARSIRSNVAIAVNNLQNSTASLRKSKQAVAAYRLAVKNEKAKYRLGMATLLDVINMEDRLTDSRLSEISAEAQVATSIAQVRFETGTLLPSPDHEVYSITAQNLTTIPKTLLLNSRGKG